MVLQNAISSQYHHDIPDYVVKRYSQYVRETTWDDKANRVDGYGYSVIDLKRLFQFY